MAVLKDLIVQGASRFIGDVFGTKFVLAGGTSSQFLKADGSTDSTAYVPTGRTVSTASGLTGGGNLSANRTLGLAAVTVGNYGSSSAVTSYTVSVDSYGRVSSAAPRVCSAVTVSSNLTNVTCPADITGTTKSGAIANVVYVNGGTTTNYTITVSTSYKTPNGEQLSLTCLKGGYTEISYLNIGGVIYARAA